MHIAAQFALSTPAVFVWLAAHWQSLAANAGSTLITSIWQGAVIVCVLEIAARLMPRISAAHRFALWAGGFALSFTLPFLPLIRFNGNAATALASNFSPITTPGNPVLQFDGRWGIVIALLWLAASLIRAAALAAHSLRLRRLWKTAEPVEISDSLSCAIAQLLRRRVTVCTTELLDRPSVIGFFSPRILIPGWLLSRLTPGELEQIVLHEAQHLRRGDDWTNLLQKLSLVLFPLNPALAWIEHRLCREREMACDEGVVRITNAPRAYAACLASLAERSLERRAEALSLGAWHRRSELVHRVHQILIRKRTMSRTTAGALLASLGSMLLAGSVEMSRMPQLVAFVPERNTQAMAPTRQAQLDELLAREDAEAKSHLPAAYNAVPARAILPDGDSDQHSAAARTRRHTPQKAAPSLAPATNAGNGGVSQIASSDQLGDRVIQPEPHPQQWVVVTEWREVTSSNRVPQPISDFEQQSDRANNPAPQLSTSVDATAANASSTEPQSPGTKNQTAPPAHRFTVTQLILRVVPKNPNSTSSQPPTTTVRDGWFVIQL